VSARREWMVDVKDRDPRPDAAFWWCVLGAAFTLAFGFWLFIAIAAVLTP
jgi:hypothetical protein